MIIGLVLFLATIAFLNVLKCREEAARTETLRNVKFSDQDLKKLIKEFQVGTNRLPRVVAHTPSSCWRCDGPCTHSPPLNAVVDWSTYFTVCNHYGIRTVGIYKGLIDGEVVEADLTPEPDSAQPLTDGQKRIIRYFKKNNWFKRNKVDRGMFPPRMGGPAYAERQAAAETKRMNLVIRECRTEAIKRGIPQADLGSWEDARTEWDMLLSE